MKKPPANEIISSHANQDFKDQPIFDQAPDENDVEPAIVSSQNNFVDVAPP